MPIGIRLNFDDGIIAETYDQSTSVKDRIPDLFLTRHLSSGIACGPDFHEPVLDLGLRL